MKDIQLTSPFNVQQLSDILTFVTKDNPDSNVDAGDILIRISSWLEKRKEFDVNDAVMKSSLHAISNMMENGQNQANLLALPGKFTNNLLRSSVPKQQVTSLTTKSFQAFAARFESEEPVRLSTVNAEVKVDYQSTSNHQLQNIEVLRFNASNTNFSTVSMTIDNVISVAMSTGWDGRNKITRPLKLSLKNSQPPSQIIRIVLIGNQQDCKVSCQHTASGYVLINAKDVQTDVMNVKLSSRDLVNVQELVLTLLEIKPLSKNKRLTSKTVKLDGGNSLDDFVWSISRNNLNSPYEMYNLTIDAHMTTKRRITVDVVTFGSQCLLLTNKEWSTKGCKVVSGNKSDWTYCSCDASAVSRSLLSSGASIFATQLIIYPNKIDFDKVSWNLPAEFSENPIVMSTVVSIYIFFLMLMVWARKRDKEDFAKLPYYEVEDNKPADRYRYLVVMYTGSRHKAGTTATVVITLIGCDDQSSAHLLQTKENRLLTRGSAVTFLITTPHCLGDIQAIRLWHNNTGSSPEWYLDRFMVWDVETDTCWFVVAKRWLADNSQIDVLLHVSTARELHTFQSLYAIKTDAYLRDIDLWYSLIGMRAWSCYEMTRMQRVGCCALILSLIMLTSLMFYGVEERAGGPELFDLGYYSFKWSNVGVGLESGVLCFPVAYVVTSLFRLSRDIDFNKRRTKIKIPMEEKKATREKKLNRKYSVTSHKLKSKMKVLSRHKTSLLRTFLPSSGRFDTSTSEEIDDHQYRRLEMMTIVDVDPNSTDFKPLPWWCAYLAWMLVGGITSGCSVLSIMYGMTFGRAISREWLVSLLSGFLQSALFLEPAKALMMAYFVVVNNPRHDLKDWIPPIHCKVEPRKRKHPNRVSRQLLVQRSSNPSYRPPDVKSVSEALEMKSQLRKARRRMKNLIFHVTFLVMLSIVAVGQHSDHNYQFNRALHSMMDKEFFKIKTRQHVYDWLNGPMIDKLYEDHAQYFTDGQFIVVTPPILRQQRVEQGHTCPHHSTVSNMYSVSEPKCEHALTTVTKEMRHFKDGWKSLLEDELMEQTPWTHYPNYIALGALPFIGEHGSYSNEGYVTRLTENKTIAQGIVKYLRTRNWIDELTRLVVVETVVYNSAVRLFCFLQMSIETPNMGMLHMTSHMHIMRAHHVITSWDFVVYACLFLSLAMVLYFAVNVVRNAHEEGWKYFANFWHLLEILTLVTSVASGAIFLTKASYTDMAFVAYNRRLASCLPFFHVAACLHYSIVCVLAYTLFFTTLRTLSIMEGHPMFFTVSSTLRRAAIGLAGHALLLLIAFIAFCHMGVILFKDTIDFSNVLRSILTVVGFAAEAYSSSVILSQHPIHSAFYLLLFYFIYSKFLINFAAVILENAFRECKLLSRDLKREDVFSLGRKQMRSMFAVKEQKLLQLHQAEENPYEEIFKVPEHLSFMRAARRKSILTKMN